MTHNIRMNGQLTLSAALGSGLQLTARIDHWAVAEGVKCESRRAQRALRWKAMDELATAWVDPVMRQLRRGA